MSEKNFLLIKEEMEIFGTKLKVCGRSIEIYWNDLEKELILDIATQK